MRSGWLTSTGDRAVYDLGGGSEFPDILDHFIHLVGRRGVHLVDQGDIRHEHVGFPGIVEPFMARAMRVEQYDGDIGFVKGGVVVSAVPDDDVRLFFGRREDFSVIDSGVDHDPFVYEGFVFLPFFKGAAVLFKIAVSGKTLHRLGRQISIGHGMTDRHDLLANFMEYSADLAGGLGFSAPRPDRAYADHRFFGFQHGVGGADENEIGAFTHGKGGLVHHLHMGNITVGKGHQIRPMFFNEPGKPVFREDGDPVRIAFSRKFRGINTIFYGGDLGCRKGNHAVSGIVPEVDIEIVKIPPRGPHDDYFFDHDSSLVRYFLLDIVCSFIIGFVGTQWFRVQRDSTNCPSNPQQIIDRLCSHYKKGTAKTSIQLEAKSHLPVLPQKSDAAAKKTS